MANKVLGYSAHYQEGLEKPGTISLIIENFETPEDLDNLSPCDFSALLSMLSSNIELEWDGYALFYSDKKMIS